MAEEELAHVQGAGEGDMLKYFGYNHLPQNLQEASKPFHAMVTWIYDHIERSDQREKGIDDLLRAKDCIVRATLYPGG